MSDNFHFKPVEELEGDPPLIIGLSGMSDSGKTYSALLIAQAIARQRNGIVCAIDTEGRMKKYRDVKIYAELHPFRAVRWTPPFDGDRAIAACRAASKAGAACIIVDSASDEWEGDGGVLESHDEYLDREAGDNAEKRHKYNMSGWKIAKKPHRRWHNYMIGCSVPLILCHRARHKVKPVGGKVIDLGIMPICDDGFTYDMMFHLLMDEEKRDGSYKVLKGGYRHERGVFPVNGGKVDADAIARLLAVTTDAAPVTTPSIQWSRPMGSDCYEFCGDGDIGSDASQRALFGALRTDLEGPEPEARAIAAANQEMLMALPDAGRDALLAIHQAAGAWNGAARWRVRA